MRNIIKSREIKLKTKFGIMTYLELAYKLGYDGSYLRAQIKLLGVDAAIEKLEANNGAHHPTVVYKGKTLSIAEVENITGFTQYFIRKASSSESGGDIAKYVERLISKRASSCSVGAIKAECKRRARIGTIATKTNFATCAGRSN